MAVRLKEGICKAIVSMGSAPSQLESNRSETSRLAPTEFQHVKARSTVPNNSGDLPECSCTGYDIEGVTTGSDVITLQCADRFESRADSLRLKRPPRDWESMPVGRTDVIPHLGYARACRVIDSFASNYK